MAIGDQDGQIQIYDIRQKERINMFDHRPLGINAIKLSDQNKLLASLMDQTFIMDQVGQTNKVKRLTGEHGCHLSYFVRQH